ncbi:MAG: hypothetical protein QNJ62_05075 [Methyloceanibacter sp.]|nr:hypothetical protein [Methyloceanibacter sp.]
MSERDPMELWGFFRRLCEEFRSLEAHVVDRLAKVEADQNRIRALEQILKGLPQASSEQATTEPTAAEWEAMADALVTVLQGVPITSESTVWEKQCRVVLDMLRALKARKTKAQSHQD